MRVPSFLLCLVGSLATSGDRDEEIANPDALNEAAAWSYMKDYNADASKTCNRNTLVGWAYATDLTEANRQAVLTESLVSAHYWKETWKNVTSFEWRKFRTPELKRLFKSLSILGTAALPDYKFTRVEQMRSRITDLKRKMTSACDADELQWIWEQWREATGKKMRGMYREFIDLSSEAAKVNGES
ncbi:unnamed protein product [Darwinula stevensoni]|uniref:Uncharacterized protein n=1 Tax=Darwinula stevensoni TaxID=69355 RepID=A0A7R9A2D7_9CRUS|nr:unnamed protein product [Darwinula stevensoni]CAG0889488.1 unnamed protein product [Darwinula stevensoni]